MDYTESLKEFPLLEKIRASKKVIRRDFMSRPVSDEAQRKLAEGLLTVLQYDFTRGALSTTEHPFTDGLARNDVRVTTHFLPQAFVREVLGIAFGNRHQLILILLFLVLAWLPLYLL